VLVSIVVVLAVIGLPGLVVYVGQLGPDYRFSVPDKWADTCLGSEADVQRILDWDDADAPEPKLLRDDWNDLSIYRCDWVWHADSGASQGQLLTVTVEVRDWYSFETFEPPGSGTIRLDDDPLGGNTTLEGSSSSGWDVDRSELDGWEHGLCIESWGTAMNEYKCVASAENLRLTVEVRPRTFATSVKSKHFGPNDVAPASLTVDIGELVRETFKR